MLKNCVKTAALLFAILPSLPAQGQTQVVAVVEDFESYLEGNLGNWQVTNTNNVTVDLGLNLTGAIQGNQDIRQLASVTLGSSSYRIVNSSLSVPVPETADRFVFSMRAIANVNLSRSLTVVINTNDGTHTAPNINLALINLVGGANIGANLSSFSPPISPGGDTTINGIELRFSNTAILGINLDEHIDYLRLTRDISSVNDWNLY